MLAYALTPDSCSEVTNRLYLSFGIPFISSYTPYTKNKIPIINAIKEVTDKKGPTYANPDANNSSSHEVTLLIKIAADIYFADIKIADIKQKIAPIPLLFI